MMSNCNIYLTIVLLILVSMLADCIKADEKRGIHHHINRRETNSTNNTGDDEESACGKTCVLIIVASVLSVFLICLICAVYCAGSQKNGDGKRSAALARYGGQRRRPVSLNYFNENMDAVGANDNNPRYSNDDISNLGYNNGSYYEENEENIRNLRIKMGWEMSEDQDYRDINDGQESMRSANGSYYNQYFDGDFNPNNPNMKRNRNRSLPDLFNPNEEYSYGPRSFSLDLDEPSVINGELNGENDENQSDAIKYNGQPGAEYWRPANSRHQPIQILPPIYNENDPPQYQTLPTKVRARQVLPTGPTGTLRSVLKRSISFQDNEGNAEDRDINENSLQRDKDNGEQQEVVFEVGGVVSHLEDADEQGTPLDDTEIYTGEEARKSSDTDDQLSPENNATEQREENKDEKSIPIRVNNNRKQYYLKSSKPARISLKNNDVEELSDTEETEDEDFQKYLPQHEGEEEEDEPYYQINQQNDDYPIKIERETEPNNIIGRNIKIQHVINDDEEGRNFKVEIQNSKKPNLYEQNNNVVFINGNNNYVFKDDDKLNEYDRSNACIHTHRIHVYDERDVE